MLSVDGLGVSGQEPCADASVSGDGRLVVFSCLSDDLVPGDSNGLGDVFVRDLLTGSIERISVPPGGGEADGGSGNASISADGRFVVYTSAATNLVHDDTNGATDVFLYDRATERTWRVTRPDGLQGNDHSFTSPLGGAISDDGRKIVFVSRATNWTTAGLGRQFGVFVHDRVTRVNTLVADGVGAFAAEAPMISGNGRYVAFAAWFAALVPEDTNGVADVYVYDLRTNTVDRVNLEPDGSQVEGTHSLYASIDRDGRSVAFSTSASTLVPSDTNGNGDVFVRDLEQDVTTRVNVQTGGAEAGFGAGASSSFPRLSADGRFVAFRSFARDLVPGDPGGHASIYVHDRLTTTTRKVSIATDGAHPDSGSDAPSLSADGRSIVFVSTARNLDGSVTDDGFFRADVFLRRMGPWLEIGGGSPTASALTGEGAMEPGAESGLRAAGAPALAATLLFVATTSTPVDVAGGTLWAFPALATIPLLTDGAGELDVALKVPANVPRGTEILFQLAVADGAAPGGVALSNGLSAVVPWF